MDKYEYKIRSEEIKELIAQKEYAEAAEIADTIDWRRVKSVMMLCTISDLYKMNRRYEDSRDLLLLAYDRHPGGRSIVYSLCELSIKMGDFVMAVEYYKEFVQIAPKDSGRYVLQYKLYEAQDVSLEERIAVLEELKARDYTEKWAYELAYLYHRVGLGTKCVEECDDLVLWFGEGKYVVKAMELKMLHDPLSPDQQLKYEYLRNLAKVESGETTEPQSEAPKSVETDAQEADTQVIPQHIPTQELPTKEVEIQVKQVGVGQYDTINIQKELAENMRELWIGNESVPVSHHGVMEAETKVISESMLDQTDSIGLTEELIPPQQDKQEPTMEEVFFGETEELDATADQVMEVMRSEARGEAVPQPILYEQGMFSDEMKEVQFTVSEDTQELIMVEVPSAEKGFDRMLGMEYDGQISFVLPESEQIEKQITGQIRLEDVLLEWERMKKDSEEKHKEALRQRVKEQTGAMFTEFEAAVRDGLLEQLESGKLSAEDLEQATNTELATETSVSDGLQHASLYEQAMGNVYVAERFADEILAETVEDDSDEVEELEEIQEITYEEQNEEPAPTPEQEAPTEILIEETKETFEEVEEVYEEESTEEMVEEYADYVDEEYEYTDEAYEEYPEEETVEGVVEEMTEEGTEEVTEEEVIEEATEEVAEEVTEDEAAEEATEEVTEEEVIEEATEEAAEEVTEDEAAEEPAEETETESQDEAPKATKSKSKGRPFTAEEEELFAPFAYNEIMCERIVAAVDTISMASYTGNVIITGDEGMDTLALAKSLIKNVQNTDSNFSGKTAKISGGSLNKKDIAETLDKLSNGALIVQSACAMTSATAQKLHKVLEQEERGIIVILIDGKKTMNRFLKTNPSLKETFTARVDIAALDNDALVKHGVEHAREQEYSIDDLGVLALHTRIAELQTSDHAVNINEVKEIVDEAIKHANRKTIGHFFDIIVAKRYDDEDMIILREKDFI